MTCHIAHVSDLHFPAASPHQLVALADSLRALRPDCLVVSGDLTRRGARSEFAAAAKFLESVPGTKLVVPGNHDVPVPGMLARMIAPFARFDRYFPPGCVAENDEVLIVGLNTAMGTQWQLDWSLGNAVPQRVEAVAQILRTRRGNRLGIVACHHPLRAHPDDPRRSRTRGGEQALGILAEAGMDILLHGHLHRWSVMQVMKGTRRVTEICANTALSDRERHGGSGFNLLSVREGQPLLDRHVWDGQTYRALAGNFIP